jgi:thioredoxin reductase
MLDFALFLRGWTGDVTLLTDGRFAPPPEAAAQLARGRVRVDERRIRRYAAKDGHLAAIVFEDGAELPLDVLFARPPQRQVKVVAALELAVDAGGYLVVDERRRETSRPGIYAAGDLTTPIQGAVLAASAGMLAGAMINHDLNVEGALAGWLD